MTTAGMAQSRAVHEQYERDGYVVFRDVVDAGLIEEAREHVNWLMQNA